MNELLAETIRENRLLQVGTEGDTILTAEKILSAEIFMP